MINIERNSPSPTSLNRPAIQNYITALTNHLNDPVNNPKPANAPEYRSSDLLTAFDTDFFSKCYLTEEQFANSWAMDIEHFVPQNENPALRFEWTNLLPAAHQANTIKPRTTPAGGYLNPADPNDDVEAEIIYTVSTYGVNPDFEARDTQNVKAVNTASLLKRVHNGHDTATKKSTETLRHAIQKRHIDILNKIVEYKLLPEGTQEQFQAKRVLKEYLSRTSSFTMLMRSMPAVRLLPADFFD